MRKFLFILLLAISAIWAENSDEEFSHASIAIEGGALYLLDDAQNAFENTYYGLAEFNYSYFRNFSGVVQFGYDYLSTKSGISYPGIHEFVGRIGLDYPLPIAKPIAIGAGFSCVFMRADDDGDVSNSTLEDNETEFGFYARLNLPIVHLENWQFGAKVYFERIWTEPETSETAWFGLYLQRNLW